MAHRIFRLTITPESQPQVRRVIDFDGRATLDEVHFAIHESLTSDDLDDHLYAFFLSGNYWDSATEYVDPRSDGRRADTALLFRLGLVVGQRFVYVFDFGSEWRVAVTVTSIRDAQAPLPEPVIVEAVGELEEEDEAGEDDEGRAGDDDALERLSPLARAVIEKKDSASALALAAELHEDRYLLSALDEHLESDSPGLLSVLFDLGLQLSEAGQLEEAISVIRAYTFMAENELNGDLAIVYARAGRREEALAQIAQNLNEPSYPYVAESKAGDAYRALGELDSAEAYYRRALVEAESDVEYREGKVHLATFLIEIGREADAREVIESPDPMASPKPTASPVPKRALATAATSTSVGRNDPCPCGSGKKYKKCHGA